MEEEEACRTPLKLIDLKAFNEGKIEAAYKKTNALANPIRLKILSLLVAHKELCVCEIENALGLKQSKVSYHLSSLMDGEFIRRRQSGPWSYYSLTDNATDILQLFDIN